MSYKIAHIIVAIVLAVAIIGFAVNYSKLKDSVVQPSEHRYGPARPLDAELPRVPTPLPNCNSNYSGCLKINAGDYDCRGGSGNGPNYTGTVQVLGSDIYDLDRDNDGWGCE